MEANLKALSARSKDSPALQRYEEVARLLTGRSSARAKEGAEWITSMCFDLAVPGLSTFGLTAGDLPAVVEKAQRSSSMRGNPIQLTQEELQGILKQAL